MVAVDHIVREIAALGISHGRAPRISKVCNAIQKFVRVAVRACEHRQIKQLIKSQDAPLGDVEKVEKVADEVHFPDAVTSRSAAGPGPAQYLFPQEVLNGTSPERCPVPAVHAVVNAKCALLSCARELFV